MENNIGERIVGFRKKNGLTQLQLAEKLNISDKAVSKWESGKGDPSVEMLVLLSDLFDCSIDYLVKGKDKGQMIEKNKKIESDKNLTYAEKVWKEALDMIRQKVSALSFDVWLSNVKAVGIEQGFSSSEYWLTLSVPSLQFKNVIVKKYDSMIKDSVMKVNKEISCIYYKIEDIFSDPYFKNAVKLAIENKGVSVAFIQRRLQIGYSRAAQIVDGMEAMKFVSSMNGRKLRDVYIDEKKYEEVFGESFEIEND